MKYKIIFYLAGFMILCLELLCLGGMFKVLKVPKDVGMLRSFGAGFLLVILIKLDELFDYWNKLRKEE